MNNIFGEYKKRDEIYTKVNPGRFYKQDQMDFFRPYEPIGLILNDFRSIEVGKIYLGFEQSKGFTKPFRALSKIREVYGEGDFHIVLKVLNHEGKKGVLELYDSITGSRNHKRKIVLLEREDDFNKYFSTLPIKDQIKLRKNLGIGWQHA